MGKAKERQDKFYKLAKDSGYRSRAAFKLIQLNERFDFLSSAQIAIDLCSAPGGWLQVLCQYMPVNSFKIGIDLVPIKPIPKQNCITFCEDITTKQCYKTIKYHLKGSKADLVLNDGSPNMGTAWELDAYQQNELALASLRLSTAFLKLNGCFITKIFRSADYNSLIWVFNKLFDKVQATKPKASRSQSAEIYVICQGYKAPEKIDPKLLDPKYVFQETITETSDVKNLNDLVKTKRNREGYDEKMLKGLYNKGSLQDFLDCENPFQYLAEHNSLEIQHDILDKYPFQSENMIEYGKDLRVLGKSELQLFIKWRSKIKNQQKEKPEQEKAQILNSDEELENEVSKERKKQKKLKKKQKIIEQRRALSFSAGLNLEGDKIAPVEEDDELMFTTDLFKFSNKAKIQQIDQDQEEVKEKSEQQDESHKSEQSEQSNSEEDEMEEQFTTKKITQDIEDLDIETRKRYKLKQQKELKQKEKAYRWYEDEIFQDIDKNLLISDRQKRKLKKKKDREKLKEEKKEEIQFETVQEDVTSGHIKLVPPESQQALAETLALGTALLRKKRKRDIIESTFSQWTIDDLQDPEVPEWFKDDQKKFCVRPLPITKQEVDEQMEKLQAHDVKTPKKVLEAKARKKRKVQKRLKKARSQAEEIVQNDEMNDNSKLKQINKLYRNAMKENKPKKKYVVAKKFKLRAGGRVRAPKNSKVVDKRMKKDKRALKSKSRMKRRK